WSVGKVLEKLKELGLDKNTLVIFTSDNGPWLKYKVEGGKAYPLRYGKATVFEGGQRVPCIMRWPGKIPAGSVCHEFAAAMDVYPTLALLAGASLPRGRVIDGKDIWPLMSGSPGATSPHDALFYIIDNQVLGLRKGQWKYILKHRPISWAFPPKQAPGEVSEALYDLSSDIGESVNVIDAHPTVVQELKELRRAFIADLAKNSRPAGVVGK
ncbi:sulfatase-like hydrolase/transferase, partial [Candidatus Poribacteria bacterium]|nr:sulfatase-like hydrolase/transferase [Candidatus Poribacteria bacterium]